MRKAFKCPECGSRRYLTLDVKAPAQEWVRQCYYCSFKWLAADDHKHFFPVKKRKR